MADILSLSGPDRQRAVDAVIATNPSQLVRVPARHLLRGDVTGSGEVVLSVSAGARTPRGMVDVLLQKAERKRAAIWNAKTIIGVRRGAAVPVQHRRDGCR